eukprot:gene17082-8599_t
MGKNDRCCVGSCDNDTRYPDKLVKRNHVEKLRWHRFTEDPGKWKQWISLISKGRADFNPGPWTYVCSNHFVDGRFSLSVQGFHRQSLTDIYHMDQTALKRT